MSIAKPFALDWRKWLLYPRRGARREETARIPFRSGRIIGKLPSLRAIRERALRQVAALPERLRMLTPSKGYPVKFSKALRNARVSLRESDGGIDR